MHPISRPGFCGPRSPIAKWARCGPRRPTTIWGTWTPNLSPPIGINHLDGPGPGAEPVQRDRRRDVGEVRQGLREVAGHLASPGVELLREQTQVVAGHRRPVERLARLLDPP